MNILIPIAKGSKKIKSVKHKSLIKIEKNVTLLEFQIRQIYESIKDETVVINLIVDEYQNEITENIQQILNKSPINVIIKIWPIHESLSVAIKLAFQKMKNKECILIMGDVIFNSNCISALSEKKISSFLVDTKNLFNKNEIGLWEKDLSIKYFCYSLPQKWMQICYLNSEFIRNYNALCSNKLLVHEIFNKVLDITTAKIIEDEHAKAVELDKPKDVRLAKQVFT